MSIDPRTVILLAGVMGGMMSLVLFFMRRNYPTAIVGLGEWDELRRTGLRFHDAAAHGDRQLSRPRLHASLRARCSALTPPPRECYRLDLSCPECAPAAQERAETRDQGDVHVYQAGHGRGGGGDAGCVRD